MGKDYKTFGAHGATKTFTPLPTDPARIRRRWHRALARMTALQRAILYELAVNDADYRQVAERYGLTIGEVEAHFAVSLHILVRAFDTPASRRDRLSSFLQSHLPCWLREP